MPSIENSHVRPAPNVPYSQDSNSRSQKRGTDKKLMAAAVNTGLLLKLQLKYGSFNDAEIFSAALHRASNDYAATQRSPPGDVTVYG